LIDLKAFAVKLLIQKGILQKMPFLFVFGEKAKFQKILYIVQLIHPKIVKKQPF